jgi:predicted ATPase
MPRSTPTLRSLTLRNFRAFEDVTIALAPITILVGPNNAGKSSVLSAIRTLSQTLNSVDPETSFLLEELGSYKDAVYKHETKRSIGFNLTFEVDSRITSLDLTYGYRVQRREVVLKQFIASDSREGGPQELLLRTTYAMPKGKQLIRELRGTPDIGRAKASIAFMHFIPRLNAVIIDRLFKKIKPQPANKEAQPVRSMQFARIYFELNRSLIRLSHLLLSLQYLGPFRETPSRVYPFAGERPSILGQSGKGASDVLMTDYFRRGRKKGQLTSRVRSWLKRASIAEDIQIDAIGDRHYQVRLQHQITGELSNILDVGYGASQVLPILVAGYDIPENSLLMVEQPEIHLHPKAQSELGELFADIYRRNVQCIVETHSEHLIMRLQTKVALGEIPKEDIVFHYVDPTATGKRIVTLTLNDKGLFKEKWPSGFFDERLSEALNLARAPYILSEKDK